MPIQRVKTGELRIITRHTTVCVGGSFVDFKILRNRQTTRVSFYRLLCTLFSTTSFVSAPYLLHRLSLDAGCFGYWQMAKKHVLHIFEVCLEFGRQTTLYVLYRDKVWVCTSDSGYLDLNAVFNIPYHQCIYTQYFGVTILAEVNKTQYFERRYSWYCRIVSISSWQTGGAENHSVFSGVDTGSTVEYWAFWTDDTGGNVLNKTGYFWEEILEILKKILVFLPDDTDGTQYHQYLLVRYSVPTQYFGVTMLTVLNKMKYFGADRTGGTEQIPVFGADDTGENEAILEYQSILYIVLYWEHLWTISSLPLSNWLDCPLHSQLSRLEASAYLEKQTFCLTIPLRPFGIRNTVHTIVCIPLRDWQNLTNRAPARVLLSTKSLPSQSVAEYWVRERGAAPKHASLVARVSFFFFCRAWSPLRAPFSFGKREEKELTQTCFSSLYCSVQRTKLGEEARYCEQSF